MIDYRKLGEIPDKPHTVFEPGGKMVAEHVISRDGFCDVYSILYQKRAPTHETRAELFIHKNPFFPSAEIGIQKELLRRHFRTQDMKTSGTFFDARSTLFYNADCAVGMVKMDAVTDKFFANGDSDELYFVAEGQGALQTCFGILDYVAGDYLYVPKGVPYRFSFNGPQNMMVVDGSKGFGIPKEFRNMQGQLRMDAPYTHRDFRAPTRLLNLGPKENYPIVVLRNKVLSLHEYTEWPYQVVGWDGWMWPFAFHVDNYQPKTSSVHLPPTIHTVFAAHNFVIMNFVPRMVDYHPRAVPCPYPHSSVDCDEVLFYVKGNFTSRKGIDQYSMSFHPGGIPHGPHPEKYEKSVGHKFTDELAIMVDTFAPLVITDAARAIEDPTYHFSWNTAEHL